MSEARTLREREGLIFERSSAGRIGYQLPPLEVPQADPAATVPAGLLRGEIDGLPEVSEVDVMRHFTRLSKWNYSLDEGMYPLGSCTMKYNPRINEEVARLAGLAHLHPLQPADQVQGALALMWQLEQALIAVTGMARVTLQPAAGAHGELTGMLMIRKALAARGERRTKVLIPDSAHGTNPASAVFAGFETVEVASTPNGTLDLATVARHLDGGDVAALMVTVPNTLGVFEPEIVKAAAMLHEKGAYLYMDGANLNAFVGIALPGKMGADALHINLHKTFATPHGGGGPGAGPVAVSQALVPHLPVPMVEREGDRYTLAYDRPGTIGKVRGFYGNFGMLVRALAYIRSLGRDGLKSMAEGAVLNANYLRARLEGDYHLQYDGPSLHEVVFDDSIQAAAGVKNIDIAKRLLDYGFHPPTMSFPLIVHGALMIEPTESEGIDELDAFVAAMKAIAREAREEPDTVKGAPYSTPVQRLDEVRAARQPVLRWRRPDD
ncbi:MAG: glycine dehydrogenase (aminomethyl-transferring) [Acidobacteria bacterium 37-65-4]|nr:MAG: glycine dehydrogenase (aminomethyl-transferring) [Acidobacteria bacterium 21-70-11]OYW07146.1 MAG: glycine dehydrogenase (aminomethyl-transferring) [Acidobacteria bacterium 37-65-4]HQT93126.1 aminomethyl-transferring glycine dehydrogenase subunit GcvPB [Thermoanaerobaculaceae bacterium]HQU33293.1 aminomethyl-transferring glycine dehydrogenase subunit GcvPB [Thermoanaerobaculaceae bacterium]